MDASPAQAPADAPAEARAVTGRLLTFFALLYVVEGAGQVAA